jgi:NAD(P)-dependent dehydrogenase (short-subunit alcohol dehydrogenase family)
MTSTHNNALITGGSRGLGLALGRQLAAQGAHVVLVARDPEALQHAVDHINQHGGTAHGIVADIGDPDAATRIAGEAAALVGTIDLLVHNASTLGPTPLRPLLDIRSDQFERTLQVNLLGPFRLTRALAGQMALRGGGLVVHISSDAAVEAYPGWGVYGAAKAALDHLGRVWAAELAEQGVRFLVIDPGEMDTRLHAVAMPEADPTTLTQPEAVAAAILALAPHTPSGTRLSIPEVTR